MNLRPELLEKYKASAKHIISYFDYIPETAIIAGSGIADTLNNSNFRHELPYANIPGLPQTTVAGHKGSIILYNAGNKNGLIFSGRFHHYEGRKSDEIISLVIISKLIGIKKLILTNAAGGLSPLMKPGDIMIVEDFIDFMFMKNSNYLNDKKTHNYHDNNVYNLSRVINPVIAENGIRYHQGTYAAVTGPNYETRAEIRMLRLIGADAVGMSTVPEIKAAISLELNYFAFSLITNSAKEIIQYVSHEEVLNEAAKAASKVKKIIEICINL